MTLDDLRETKTIQLTTFRRDGRPVRTPVSIAFDGDRAFFRTYAKAHKARRLRANPNVEAAPATTMKGVPTGGAVPARATLLDGDEALLARRTLARRFRFLHQFLVPLSHKLMRTRTLHYELTPRTQDGTAT
jgi:PPOX class probable F420-dependent enzyme